LQATLYRYLDKGSVPRTLWAGLLREPSASSKALAAQVLASSADPSSVPLLRQLLSDLDPGVRRQALVAAGRIGAAADQLPAIGLGSSTPAVRRAAVWAACHTGGEAVGPLLALLGSERTTAVLETAVSNLWRLEGVAWEAHAVRFAGHQDPLLRRAAAYSLSRGDGGSGRSEVRGLCRDPEPVIRATALRALARGPVASADVKVVLVALEDDDWRVAVEACKVLAAQPEMRVTEDAAATIRSMWESSEAHLAVSAVQVAGAHPEVGGGDVLEGLCAGAEPWLATVALEALSRRGSPAAAEVASVWIKGKGWQRRAAAAVAARLPDSSRQVVEQAAMADPAPAVRLAWLEGVVSAGLGERHTVLWRIVTEDSDPAVRAQAVEHLREAGAVKSADKMMTLYRSWVDDEMADAKAAALVAALEAGADPDSVLDLAAADPDAAVGALVTNAARRRGHSVAQPPRDERHGRIWYRDLVEWAGSEHWLDVVTVRGTFRVRLDMTAALTAREVWELAASGFYDDLTFHRVVPGFVVQGGDPRGDGWGGPGFVLPDEPTLAPFDRWRVGIATSGPNTGGCQFFVTLMPEDRLTGHYTNFGEVVRGRDVVERLRVGDRIVSVETHSGSEPPPPNPVLLGDLEWEQLQEIDGWLEEWTAYESDPDTVEWLRSAAGEYSLVSVIGTWCSDSRREISRLERILEQIEGERFEHWIVGVDRSKRVEVAGFPAGLLSDNTAERVPTIIVLDASGHELGRVVETAERPLEELLMEFVAAAEGQEVR